MHGGIGAVAGGGASGQDYAANIAEEFSVEEFSGQLPGQSSWTIDKIADLRYGENPHQNAALYQMATTWRHRQRRSAFRQRDVVQQLR